MKFSSPVYNIISVPIEKIEPNTYNPNSVAPPELKLLYDSIKEDGSLCPSSAIMTAKRSVYNRRRFSPLPYYVDYQDIYEREGGNCRYLSSIAHRLPDGKHDQA